MRKVLVSDKLSEEGLKILHACPDIAVDVKTGLKPDELKEIIGGYEALIIRSSTTVTADLLEAAGKLKLIGRAGIGVDNVDLEAASKHGIIVENTPSGNAVTTAEHAIAMMFAASRMIPQAHKTMKEGKWDKKSFVGHELCNKTLGVVGVGNIGKIVANRALGLKMKVVGFDPFLTPEAATAMGIELLTLQEVFQRSDYITVHVPLNDKTRNLLNREAFQTMKKGVYIINCARGGVVCEKDLLEALKEGKVGGAALDVFEQEPPAVGDELIQHPLVVCTPHLGASTDEAQVNVAIEVAEQVVDYFTKNEVRNAVNSPSVSSELAKILKPYLALSEKIGLLQGQLTRGIPKKLTIEYTGDIAKYPVSPLTISILKGLLEPILSDVSVNFVNSPVIAKERGLKVFETKSEDAQDFASLITVTFETSEETRIVSGTIFGNVHPRLVRIDNFYFEAVPEGHLLVIKNNDRPGVIGNIGTLLGENQVNISRMQLGLHAASGEALSVYNVDDNVSEQILEKLRKLPNILGVQEVKL